MCGIMGFSRLGDVVPETKELIRNTLSELTIRGSQATGIGLTFKEGQDIYAKRALPGNIFSTLPLFDKAFENSASLNNVIGHTRFATHGSHLDNLNNHPHISQDKRWMLVHNGVLSNWPKNIEGELKSECDSEVLVHYIAKFGPQKGIEKIVKDVTGDYAFIALDRKTTSCYMYHDSSRPLVATTMKKYGGIFFCSTEKILENGLMTTTGEKFAKDAFLQVPEYHLYRIRPGEEALKNLGQFGEEKKKNNITSYRGSSKPYQGGHWDYKENRWVPSEDAKKKNSFSSSKKTDTSLGKKRIVAFVKNNTVLALKLTSDMIQLAKGGYVVPSWKAGEVS